MNRLAIELSVFELPATATVPERSLAGREGGKWYAGASGRAFPTRKRLGYVEKRSVCAAIVTFVSGSERHFIAASLSARRSANTRTARGLGKQSENLSCFNASSSTGATRPPWLAPARHASNVGAVTSERIGIERL